MLAQEPDYLQLLWKGKPKDTTIGGIEGVEKAHSAYLRGIFPQFPKRHMKHQTPIVMATYNTDAHPETYTSCVVEDKQHILHYDSRTVPRTGLF